MNGFLQKIFKYRLANSRKRVRKKSGIFYLKALKFSFFIINEIQQLGDDEKENFQKFGEFYSSSIIESDEQKRRIKKQLLNIKKQGLDMVIIVNCVRLKFNLFF